MAKIYLIIFFTCFIGILCSAQQTDVDSMRSLLAKNTTEDTSRITLLIRCANATLYTKPDSMMDYVDEALSISKKIKWQPGIARSLQAKGVAYSYVVNNQVAALTFYHQALDANKNPFNKALEFGTIANIATIFYNQKQYDEALKYFQKALSILNTLENKNGEEQLLLNIGNVYYDKNSGDTAKSYFARSLAMAEQKKNLLITLGSLNALSTFYVQSKNYPLAEVYIEKSLLLNKTNNLLLKVVSLMNMAFEKYYTNQLDSAEIYGKESLAAAEAVNSMQFRRQAWDVLSMIYEKKGAYKNAFEAARNFNVLNDSLLSDEGKQEITRRQMQYEFDEKEILAKADNDKKQVLATAEINKQKIIRNASIGIGTMLVLVAIAGIILYKRRKDTIEKKKEAEFNTQVAYTELKALRAQMNPHFIYNSLNSINDYIDKNETQMATSYTTKFAKLMRMILENSEQKEVPLADDLKALELYMQLESLRMQHKFTYEIKVDENIDRENTLIPPLILQPFVENSIWHGISKKQGVGKILIHIHKEGNMINCIVEDNGIGMQESAEAKTDKHLQPKKSFGMKITKSRIDIINQMKKSNAAITMSNLEPGTKIVIKLPEALAF